MIKLADYGAFLVTVEQYVSAEFRYAGTGSLPGTPKDIAWLEKTFGKYSTPIPRFRKDQRFGMMPYARFIPLGRMPAFAGKGLAYRARKSMRGFILSWGTDEFPQSFG